MLPRIRRFCAQRTDIFHYEVEDVDQIGEALDTIADVEPQILVINGGDGTVQATMTEIHHGGHFGDRPPPIAVLPNGKTNLIALDLGASGDPIDALERIMEIAREGLDGHVVGRELIALTGGDTDERPVIGMFLGGAGLADTILYCRHKVYPLGLPNGLSHALTVVALLFSAFFKAGFLPPRARPVRVSVHSKEEHLGKFSLLVVTTLERLLLKNQVANDHTTGGPLKLMMVEQRPMAMFRFVWASLLGKLGHSNFAGVHLTHGDAIEIAGEESSVILDGEIFQAANDRPIKLTPTRPVPFLSLAA